MVPAFRSKPSDAKGCFGHSLCINPTVGLLSLTVQITRFSVHWIAGNGLVDSLASQRVLAESLSRCR